MKSIPSKSLVPGSFFRSMFCFSKFVLLFSWVFLSLLFCWIVVFDQTPKCEIYKYFLAPASFIFLYILTPLSVILGLLALTGVPKYGWRHICISNLTDVKARPSVFPISESFYIRAVYKSIQALFMAFVFYGILLGCNVLINLYDTGCFTPEITNLKFTTNEYIQCGTLILQAMISISGLVGCICGIIALTGVFGKDRDWIILKLALWLPINLILFIYPRKAILILITMINDYLRHF